MTKGTAQRRLDQFTAKLKAANRLELEKFMAQKAPEISKIAILEALNELDVLVKAGADYPAAIQQVREKLA